MPPVLVTETSTVTFPRGAAWLPTAQVAVFERRIAQAVPEFIERRAGDVLIFALMGCGRSGGGCSRSESGPVERGERHGEASRGVDPSPTEFPPGVSAPDAGLPHLHHGPAEGFEAAQLQRPAAGQNQDQRFLGLGQFGGRCSLDFGKRDRRARGRSRRSTAFLSPRQRTTTSAAAAAATAHGIRSGPRRRSRSPGRRNSRRGPGGAFFQPGEEAHRVLFAAVCRPRAEQVQPVLRHWPMTAMRRAAFSGSVLFSLFQQHHRLSGRAARRRRGSREAGTGPSPPTSRGVRTARAGISAAERAARLEVSPQTCTSRTRGGQMGVVTAVHHVHFDTALKAFFGGLLPVAATPPCERSCSMAAQSETTNPSCAQRSLSTSVRMGLAVPGVPLMSLKQSSP